jgi:hypothetical protein
MMGTPQVGGYPEEPMSATAKKARNKSEYHFRIELKGKVRDDGSLFVTSSNLPPFSAVIEDGNWTGVLKYLKRFLEVNFGPVKELRLIRDASELIPKSGEKVDRDGLPPAYVLAQVMESSTSRARTT